MQRLSLAALAEKIANQESVPGLELVATIGEQRIYCANWALAATGDQVCCLGDVSALDQIERVAAIDTELQKLIAEKEALLQVFNLPKAEQVEQKSEPKIEQQIDQADPQTEQPEEQPEEQPAEQSKAKKPKTRTSYNKPLVWCQVDGCDLFLPAGAGIAKHRQLVHQEWFKRQQALADDHPLKAARNDLISPDEAMLTDNLPPVPTADAAHEVAESEIPFTPVLAEQLP